MTSIDLKTIIPNILEHVSFHNYLINEHYNVVEHASGTLRKAYYKETLHFKDIIYLSLVEGKDTFYSLSFGDTGDIITFVKNRIEIDGTYNEFNPKKNNIIEACKKLLLYLNDHSESQEKIQLTTIESSSFKAFQKQTFTQFYNVEEIYNTEYLNKKGISNETIHSIYFANKIFNTIGLYYNGTSHDVINTTFPIYDLKDNEVGLINMNTIALAGVEEDITVPVTSSNIKKGFWISNKIKEHKSIKTKLTLVDNPIEALSHCQAFDNQRLYISFFEKSEKVFDVIYNLIQNHSANLFLASNVSLNNLIFELRLLIHIIGKEHDIEFNIETPTTVNIRLKNSKHIKLFTERIQRINNRIIKDVLSSLGDTSRHLVHQDIIKASKTEHQTLTFKIPKNLQMLYEISKIIVSTFECQVGIVTEKSTQFSWQNLSEDTKILSFKNINY